MQNLSTAQRKHLENAGHVKVTINIDPITGDPFTVKYDDIVQGSFSIERNWAHGDALEIGCADTSELTFTLHNHEGQWNQVRWEGARLSVVLDIGGEPLQAGIFTVDERPGRLTTLEIRALDDMARLNRPWVPGISFPATLFQILQDACSQCNVTLGTLEFDNDDYVVGQKPEGDDITNHHIVAWIAQLAGSNAWIDPLGRLQLSWYGDNQSGDLEIGPRGRFEYELAEKDIEITGIVYRTEEIDYLVGTEDYALIIEDNPLLQEGYESVLATLYSKIEGFRYRPYSFSILGYPHLWPGDVITTLIDADGNELTSIITNHTYVLNGNSQIEARGETETVRGYATGAPFTASQKRVLQSVARVEASRQVSSLEQATLQLNELMVNSLGFYTTTIESSGGGKVVYTHDKPLLTESQIIWTRTEQGFAWTDSGWNAGSPVWQYGVASDGNMIIKLLTAIGINAEWIRLEPHANLLNDSNQTAVEFFGGVAAPVTFFTTETEPLGLEKDETVTASVNLVVYEWEGQIRLDLVFYSEEPVYGDLDDPAVISYVSSGDIWANGTFSVTGIVPAGTKIIKLQARPYYPDIAPYIGGEYKEVQLERGDTATPWKPYPSEESLEGYVNSIANGRHYGGSFLSGRVIYSPNVIGMQGTFKDLLAGTPGGARLELGESAGDPFLRAFGDNGALRAELLKDKLKFSDEQGNFAGEISGGTVDDNAAMILRAFVIITGLGSNVFFLGDTHFHGNMYARIDGVNKQIHTIIDSGSNENGSYIKYSDGTMECWHEGIATYLTTNSLIFYWTYPQGFVEEPDVQLTIIHPGFRGYSGPGSTSAVGISYIREIGTTSVRVQVQSVPAAGWVSDDERHVKCRAIGRWRM